MTTSLAFFREHTSPDVEHLYQQHVSDASVGSPLTGRATSTEVNPMRFGLAISTTLAAIPETELVLRGG
jgi:hypothetical protein